MAPTLHAGSSPKVLVAEGDSIITAMLLDILRDDGYDVQIAGSDAHVHTLMHTFQPNVLIVDADSPVRGWATVMQRNRYAVRVPVVVLTTSRAYLSTQFYPHTWTILDKPFTLDDFLACVKQALR